MTGAEPAWAWPRRGWPLALFVAKSQIRRYRRQLLLLYNYFSRKGDMIKTTTRSGPEFYTHFFQPLWETQQNSGPASKKTLAGPLLYCACFATGSLLYSTLPCGQISALRPFSSRKISACVIMVSTSPELTVFRAAASFSFTSTSFTLHIWNRRLTKSTVFSTISFS